MITIIKDIFKKICHMLIIFAKTKCKNHARQITMSGLICCATLLAIQ